MASGQAHAAHAAQTNEPPLVVWIKQNQKILTYVGAGIALVAAVVWWFVVADQRKEIAAQDALAAARAQFDIGSLAEAATGFNQVSQRFSGTSAAAEALLLINQIRLTQGQAALAAQNLETVAPAMPRQFRATTYNLLGAAWEDAGEPNRAAEAYATAAAAATYDFEVASALLAAARAHTAAGDTAGATQSYQRVIDNYAENPLAQEARLRLAELTRGEGTPPQG